MIQLLRLTKQLEDMDKIIKNLKPGPNKEALIIIKNGMVKEINELLHLFKLNSLHNENDPICNNRFGDDG